jgi:hypothetical protein
VIGEITLGLRNQRATVPPTSNIISIVEWRVDAERPTRRTEMLILGGGGERPAARYLLPETEPRYSRCRRDSNWPPFQRSIVSVLTAHPHPHPHDGRVGGEGHSHTTSGGRFNGLAHTRRAVMTRWRLSLLEPCQRWTSGLRPVAGPVHFRNHGQ